VPGVRYDSDQGVQALDINALIDSLLGWGWISGGAVIPGDGNFEVAIGAVEVLLDGEKQTLSSSTLDLDKWFVGSEASDEPRKVLICVGPQGGFTVEAGDPAPADPPQFADPFDTNDPEPPDFFEVGEPPVPLAEVWVGEDDLQLTGSEIRDRRQAAYHVLHSVEANVVEVNDKLIDATDKELSGAIALETDIPSDAEIQSIVADGYFSGSHNDLTDVTADQHHASPGTTTWNDAVRAIEVDSLQRTTAGNGEFLSATGWAQPPQLEAPVIASSDDAGFSELTHTAGGPTFATIDGAVSSRTAEWTIIFGESETSDYAATDHAWHPEWHADWDAANGHWDIDVSLIWDDDPDDGGSTDVSWTIYETTPAVVQGKWDSSKTIDALAGENIFPAAVTPSDAINIPVLDDLADYPGAYLQAGSEVYATGSHQNWTQGKYIYTGSVWDGPFGEGISTLSQLTIDADKSMTPDTTAYTFTDLAEPTDPSDAARKADVDAVDTAFTDHTTSSSAHEATIQQTGRERDMRTHDLTMSGGVKIGDGGIALTTKLPDGASLDVYHAQLSVGVDEDPPSGVDLVFVTFDGAGGYSKVNTDGGASEILTGDGTESGGVTTGTETSPAASYTNSSGSAQRAGIVIDNGEFNAGSGTDRSVELSGLAEQTALAGL
jgi:hypothetical protein